VSCGFNFCIGMLICCSVAGSVVAGPLEDGLHAFDVGQYARAMGLLRPLAARGDARAQYKMGIMHEDGRGVPVDYSEAVGWLLQAADQGNADARSHLGFLYLYGRGVTQDYVAAYTWFDLAATAGNEHAAFSRDLVAAKMTPSQVAEAQKLASERKSK
jgi:uncharacterized protein